MSSFEKKRTLIGTSEKVWLSLADLETLGELKEVVETIYPTYQKNYDAWAAYFWDAAEDHEFFAAYEDAKTQGADPAIIRCMEQDLGFRRK